MSVASGVQSSRASLPQPVAGVPCAPVGAPRVGPARSGHSLGSIRTAAPAGPAQVLQPLLTRDAFRSQGGRSSGLFGPLRAAWRLVQPQQLTDIDGLIHQYHQHAANDADQGSVHTRLALLDRIEHHAYQWFDQNRDTDPTHATHRSLRALLDSVQADHQGLIAATDRHDHSLWVPDSAELGHRSRRDLQALWRNLRQGRGQIRIHPETREDPNTQDANFRASTLSSFARLLSRQQGRELVRRVDAGRHRVDLHPMHPDAQRARPNNAVTGAIDGAAVALPAPGRANGYQPGPGGASVMRLDPRMSDTASTDNDDRGRRIFAPAFVTLGHELIHARRNQQGVNLERLPRYGRGNPLEAWGNPEEHATIETGGLGTENALRAEHGLSARHGHEGGRPWEEPPRTLRQRLHDAWDWYQAARG